MNHLSVPALPLHRVSEGVRPLTWRVAIGVVGVTLCAVIALAPRATARLPESAPTALRAPGSLPQDPPSVGTKDTVHSTIDWTKAQREPDAGPRAIAEYAE